MKNNMFMPLTDLISSDSEKHQRPHTQGRPVNHQHFYKNGSHNKQSELMIRGESFEGESEIPRFNESGNVNGSDSDQVFMKKQLKGGNQRRRAHNQSESRMKGLEHIYL